MPKREHKIVAFHGGINDNSDPKDITDDEMRVADGVSTSRIGRLVGVGNASASALFSGLNNATNDLQKGYGLFHFSTDRDSAEAQNSEDWLAVYNKTDGKVRLFYRDKENSEASPGFFTAGAIPLGTSSNPSFYFADGNLRVSDSTFTNSSKWHGFIDSNLFQKSSTTTNDILTINKWVNTDQKHKSFSDLSVALDTYTGSGNPPSSQITAVDLTGAGRIVLNYWTGDDGDWNGVYQFAAAPIYKGDQEGELTEFSDIINFYDNQVVFQVYVCLGTSSTLSDDSDHPLQDDRIEGINFYFRSGADEDWYFLMKTDLTEGGQHNWGVYNATDDVAKGIFTGTLSIVDGNDDLYLANTTGSAGSKTAPSYANTTLTLTITNNATGFDNRYGFIRVWGGHTSPVWLNAESDGDPLPLTTATYAVALTTPGEGGREFMVELLDENFTVIKASDKVNITITDSGAEPPPTYDYERSE
jgi:hypothetical protein|tara:strand:- start:1205 stop:2620 length:1416 start_codon:yes stop_codon:yes gene_type:complete